MSLSCPFVFGSRHQSSLWPTAGESACISASLKWTGSPGLLRKAQSLLPLPWLCLRLAEASTLDC